MFSAPLTIAEGGTYGGRYESLDSDVPAITIATAEPVHLHAATVRHAGIGIARATGYVVDLTVTDSAFTSLAPTVPGCQQQAIRLDVPAALAVDHCSFVAGHGIQVYGDNVTPMALQITNNDFVDIGRTSQPVGRTTCAIKLNKIVVPGGKVNWNRVTNHRGLSVTEDVFGFTEVAGEDGNPLEVANNLVNGSYPYTGDGADFRGSAINLGDLGGAYIEGHDNVAVNYTNVGLLIPSGTGVHQVDSLAVHDGIADDGQRCSSAFGLGLTTYHPDSYPPSTDVGFMGCVAGHLRYVDGVAQRADYWFPVGDNVGNGSLPAVDSAAKKAAIDAFEESVVSNGQTIGRRC